MNGPAGMFRRSKARVGGPVAPTVRVESSRVLRTGEGPQAYGWEPLSDVVGWALLDGNSAHWTERSPLAQASLVGTR